MDEQGESILYKGHNERNTSYYVGLQNKRQMLVLWQ